MANRTFVTAATQEGEDLLPDKLEARNDELLAWINEISGTYQYAFPDADVGQFLKIDSGGPTGRRIVGAAVADIGDFTSPTGETGDFTADNFGYHYCDAGATVDLPPVGAGKRVRLAPKTSVDLTTSGNEVTIDIDSGDTGTATFKANGLETYTFEDNGVIEIYCQDGTTWEVMLIGILDRA
jgi:hypothetical protein